MRTFAFKSRLFMAYAAMTTVIVVLFAVLLISSTVHTNSETELRHQQELFEGHLARVETFLEQANRIAAQIASNHEILNLFMSLDEPDNAAGGGTNYFDEHLLDAIRISSLLSGINVEDEFADRLAVYNRYGDYVSAGRLYDPPDRILASMAEISSIDALMRDIQTRNDRCLVLDRNVDSEQADVTDAYITLLRPLSHTRTSKPYGLVSVQMRVEYLRGMGIWGEDGGNEYFILGDDHNGARRTIFLSDDRLDAQAVYAAAAARLDSESGKVAQLPWHTGGGNVILLAVRPTLSNWLMVRALPEASLSAPYRQIYWVLVLSSALLLCVLLLVVNFVAELISRPLRQLSANISAIGLQNMQLPDMPGQYSTQELSALDDAFRKMLGRLDQSIQVELQAYMRVLQSQMNPHFLYNVLSVIVASSESHGDKHTASMCLKLTAMLRYVADIKRETVTLEAELEHTRNYLDLMKQRYEQLFDYEIDVAEEAMAVALPRLTVQPLTENCFVHGFKNEPPWHIRVVARIDGGHWRLSVSDNGVGVTEQQLRSIEERFDEYQRDVAGHYQDLSMGGMGLINTRLRLSLMFGGALECRMENREEGGLRIEIGGPMQ